MSVTTEHRFEWQRNMTRTRMMDEALKEIFTDGKILPMAQSLVARFPLNWQEAVVAVATALETRPDSDLNAKPADGYDGDLVAPMIRDVGLSLAMETLH